MVKRLITYGMFLLIASAAFAQVPLTDTMPKQGNLPEVVVSDKKEEGSGIGRLGSIKGYGIYEGKKNEVIVIKDLDANKSTNNARQVFGKVPGINIWESDQAGLQLGVGGRGLSPNRTANFNTRQNGYDISADALGYPESYYTPPVEALEQIEVVRGASALQYGTQFGGMLNFIINKGPRHTPLQVVSRQTLGSFGYFGSFNSLGGTLHKGKINYYTFFNYKQSKGWRPNSDFNLKTAFAGLEYWINPKFKVGLEYTYMGYLAQQAGGLTDAQFLNDPRQSFRERNWFTIGWNLFNLEAEYKFNQNTRVSSKTFGLLSRRLSLGNLSPPNIADLGGNRTLIEGFFANIGNETRLIHHYKIKNQPQSVLTGIRCYLGNTQSIQGDGSDGSDADFTLNNPNNPENSDYKFKNINLAWFAENIIRLNQKWSLTPGIRAEYINTMAKGSYRVITKDFAGNVLADTSIYDATQSVRTFVLFGLGASYKPNQKLELYANITQNYRAVNFNDLRIVNPNSIVDPNIKDENGYSADLGLRGKLAYLMYDVSVFLIKYNDRIGQIIRADIPPLYRDYRYRTNIANSRNLGIECFFETDVLKWFAKPQNHKLILFTNLAWVHAIYTGGQTASVEGNRVEMAAPFMGRVGLGYKYKLFSMNLQGNRVGAHYTDASNAQQVSGGVNGIIPTYTVADCSMSYKFGRFTLEASCNNLLNAYYFTRRADAYPGPGIIPSDGRGYYLTLGLVF